MHKHVSLTDTEEALPSCFQRAEAFAHSLHTLTVPGPACGSVGDQGHLPSSVCRGQNSGGFPPVLRTQHSTLPDRPAASVLNEPRSQGDLNPEHLEPRMGGQYGFSQMSSF